jgi:hypothetical protein
MNFYLISTGAENLFYSVQITKPCMGKNNFYFVFQEFTCSEFTPPTLTLPLRRGGRGGGDVANKINATFR